MNITLLVSKLVIIIFYMLNYILHIITIIDVECLPAAIFKLLLYTSNVYIYIYIYTFFFFRGHTGDGVIAKRSLSSIISCRIWMGQKATSTQVSSLLLTCLNAIF